MALILIILWVVTGPYFNYSATWLLAIETPATIVTFVMVFLIQNTQNRDMAALQLKLSELIFVMEGAQNRVAIAEHLSEKKSNTSAMNIRCGRKTSMAQPIKVRKADEN